MEPWLAAEGLEAQKQKWSAADFLGAANTEARRGSDVQENFDTSPRFQLFLLFNTLKFLLIKVLVHFMHARRG